MPSWFRDPGKTALDFQRSHPGKIPSPPQDFWGFLENLTKSWLPLGFCSQRGRLPTASPQHRPEIDASFEFHVLNSVTAKVSQIIQIQMFHHSCSWCSYFSFFLFFLYFFLISYSFLSLLPSMRKISLQEHIVVQSLRASISKVSGALEWGVCDHGQRSGWGAGLVSQTIPRGRTQPDFSDLGCF